MTCDHPDHYTLQVGTHVLAGAFYATRLYRDLREQAGLVYFVEAMLKAEKTRSVYAVFFGCDPPNVSKARDIVGRDLREMQTPSVSADELRQAKMLLMRKIPLSEASVDGIAGTLLDLSQKEAGPCGTDTGKSRRSRSVRLSGGGCVRRISSTGPSSRRGSRKSFPQDSRYFPDRADRRPARELCKAKKPSFPGGIRG